MYAESMLVSACIKEGSAQKLRNYLQVRMLTEDQTVILDALRNSSVVELQVWLKADIKAC